MKMKSKRSMLKQKMVKERTSKNFRDLIPGAPVEMFTKFQGNDPLLGKSRRK